MNLNQKIIKPKLGLLELAKSLGSIHQHVKRWDIVEIVITDLKNCMKLVEKRHCMKLVEGSQ
ncbi:putative transposase [Rickettsia bellii str. RML Mogi]|uniref:Putative transposase n=1 Tax=Rickettsia bellii str. RML Mogi TaxID=1359194 RepID=A0A0F3QMT3_RICBE|nr:putative transposase [Rickettsia bellii str. RML Mogi]KJV91147.1 putative transposase [Rickettsia bellii str. RML Mogi]KJV91677.1 putative transposase [Rickettsia bellii str. RML Mogi]KJV91731.1 putative transposase [Rickettsia bellii str. RML Mogi]KJV91833.1 putative transposase [Rickettsia bellii str. RML Mogi]